MDQQHLINIQSAKSVADIASIVQNLLLNHFDKFVWVLYCLDVEEVVVQKIIKQNTLEDASQKIAELIFQRLEAKKASRAKYKMPPPIDDAEKW